ncbi:hypothetical protein BOBR111200_25375 [Bordetella bronchialis]
MQAMPLPRAVQAALVNNSGLASAGAIWNAALRPVDDRGHALRASGARTGTAPDLPDPWGAGVWVRGIDTRQHLRQAAGSRYTESLSGYTLGADRAVAVAAGRWYLGATISQVDAHRRFDDGKGRSSAVLFGAYALLRLDNGAYAGVAASGGRFRNTVQAHGQGLDETATGRFHQPGAGIALTAGQRLALARGWFLEPAVGLGYFRVGGARYTLDDGTAVHDRGGHALHTRAGIRAGRDWQSGKGNTATPYLKLTWTREYGNRGTIDADGTALRTDLSGNRVDVGAGVEARMGRRHFLYAEAEAGRGGRVSRSRAMLAGYQYRW